VAAWRRLIEAEKWFGAMIETTNLCVCLRKKCSHSAQEREAISKQASKKERHKKYEKTELEPSQATTTTTTTAAAAATTNRQSMKRSNKSRTRNPHEENVKTCMVLTCFAAAAHRHEH